jgi:hypothetical protein
MNHLPNHPGATLVRVNADGTRVWRQRPIDFANHRTVAEVDADRLRPALRHGADVSLSHEDVPA